MLQRRTHFDDIPIKPQRVYEEMNKAFARRPGTSPPSASRRSPAPRCCTSTGPGTGSTAARRDRSAGTVPAALGVAKADPEVRRLPLRRLRLPVHDRGTGRRRPAPDPVRPRPGQQRLPGPDPPGAAGLRHRLPGQAGVREHQLAQLGVYGVDHVKVVEGLGCKAIRVTDPAELGAAFEQAKKLAAEYRVPVVVEAILERVTSISTSTTNDIGNVVEFEEIATEPGHAPTSIRTLKV